MQPLKMFVLVAVFLAYSSTIASAESCATALDRQKNITTIVNRINELRSEVERPSPEQATALRQKVIDAFNSNNREELNKILAHPMYNATQVFHSANELIEMLQSSEIYPISRQATIMINAIMRAQSYSETFAKYIEFDEQRPAPVLDQSKLISYHLLRAYVPTDVAIYAQCLVRLLKDP